MNRLPDDEPQQPEDRPPRVTEVIEQYEVQRASVLAAARELDRRRDAVRDAAEREAAEIVSAARREIRNVLVNARRDLLVLTAQIQAVGCEPGESPGAAPDTRREAAVVTPGVHLQAHSEALSTTADGTAMARRQVHEILQESRTELTSLSMDARQLRNDIANRGPVDIAASPTDDDAVAARLDPRHERMDDEPKRAAPALTYASEQRLGRDRRVPVAVAVAATMMLAVFLTVGLAPWKSKPLPDVDESVTPRNPGGAAQSRAVPEAAAPATVTSEGSRGTSSTPVALRVETRRAAWIRATVDGKSEIGRVYAPGETREIAAYREATIRAGDAGAVFVSVAGQPPQALGRDGQVVTRRFTATEPATPAREVKEPARDSAAPGLVTNARPAAFSTPSPAPIATDPFGAERLVTAKAVPAGPTAGRETRVGGPQEGSTTPHGAEATSSAEADILAQEQRWFDAYYAGDRPGMAAVATDTFTFEDERQASQRITGGVGGVTRKLDGVRTYSAGVGLVLSARMTERATVGGTVRESVGWLSEVWVRGDHGWRLMGVRIAPMSKDAVPGAR